MNIAYLSPFVDATSRFGEDLIGKAPIRGVLSVTKELVTKCPINVVTEVSGDISGIVLLGFSRETALGFCELILKAKLRIFDQSCTLALLEFGSKVQDLSSNALKETKIEFSISPPSIIRGLNIVIPTLGEPCLHIPLEFEGIGKVYVKLSVRKMHSHQAA